MPGNKRHSSGFSTGFGLLELLTAIAFLVIILGLAVSAARYVRSKDSAMAIREQMLHLNTRLAADGLPPGLPVFAPDLTAADEAKDPVLIHNQAKANAELVGAWLHLDHASLIDPWGSSIVAIEGTHPELGTSPRLKPFLLSAGPDGRFFTLSDNIYGYDSYFLSPQGGQAAVDTVNNQKRSDP